MLLTNGYKGLFAHFVTSDSSQKMTACDGAGEVSATYGYFRKSTDAAQTFCALGNILKSRPTRYGGVIFGTGNTPPALDDYDISGDVVSGIAASVEFSGKLSDNAQTLEVLYTITNNNTAAVTIGEIGAFCGSGGNNKGALLERTVLESPVTIPPGGVAQITYTLNMEHPAA